MRNLLLTLRFDGGNYHGWQVQANAPSVQQSLQDAFESICSRRDNVTGCSRTDAGVHANMYCCNIRTQNPIACDKLLLALNAVLPEDIAVTACREVPYEFHARYDCTEKEYIYRIWNSPVRNPFLRGRALHYKYELDADMLNGQAKLFTGTHDFSAFCAAGSSVEDTVRTVTLAGVHREGSEVIFTVRADGFLYNMVRIMAGTLLGIAQGKIERDTLDSVILSKNRENAGVTAPPYGLYLNKVYYPFTEAQNEKES